MKKKSHEQYEQELFEREIDAFPLEQYLGAQKAILHTCSLSHIWKVSPDSLLSSRSKCPYCAGKKNTALYKTQTDFEVLDEYVNNSTPIRHRCKQGHVWTTAPKTVLKGCGCPACANYGFDYSAPAILYYVCITENNLSYYKVGITNSTVRERFKADKDKSVRLIWQKSYDTGREARDCELQLLTKYKSERQNIDSWLKSNGNTELFEFDVLNLDK